MIYSKYNLPLSELRDSSDLYWPHIDCASYPKEDTAVSNESLCPDSEFGQHFDVIYLDGASAVISVNCTSITSKIDEMLVAKIEELKAMGFDVKMMVPQPAAVELDGVWHAYEEDSDLFGASPFVESRQRFERDGGNTFGITGSYKEDAI